MSSVLARDVCGGGRFEAGVGAGVLSGWCAVGIIIFKRVLTNLKYEHQIIFPLSINHSIHDKANMKEF